MTVGESRQQDTGVPSGERACPRARCGPVAKSRHGGRSVERPLLDYPTGTRMSARHPFGFPQESVEPKATGKTRDRGAPKARQGRNEEGNHTPEPNRSREREVAPASHPLSPRKRGPRDLAMCISSGDISSGDKRAGTQRTPQEFTLGPAKSRAPGDGAMARPNAKEMCQQFQRRRPASPVDSPSPFPPITDGKTRDRRPPP